MHFEYKKREINNKQFIAVPLVLTCGVFKIFNYLIAVKAKMSAAFYPTQLGFGIPQATEAAAHAAHCCTKHLQPGYGVLKLDFSSAFNFRDVMLQTIHDQLPELYRFLLCKVISPSFRRHSIDI